jgi:lipopolysaccharide transport system permease protein
MEIPLASEMKEKVSPVDEQWNMVIKPKTGKLSLNVGELRQSKDLLFIFVRRDFVAFYKQTILGPIWFFIQPLLTTLMYLLIFGKVAKLSTDGVPPLLFYLAGVTCWSYCSETLTKISDTFILNANIFGKVYFPRLVLPLSIVLSNLIKFAIQLILFLLVWGYFFFIEKKDIHITWALILLPYLIVLLSLLSLGLGILFSALTTKYRDLRFLLSFGVQLLMFATPVVYPLSLAPKKYQWMIVANPFTAIIEAFRYAFTGSGNLTWQSLGYSSLATLVILVIGILVFNKVERTFMDTV